MIIFAVAYGLYIHIPFCEQKCHYCAFPITLAPSAAHAPYMGRLRAELRMVGLPGAPSTLYLGGGTPSLLAPRLLEALLLAIPAGASEISIEANPGTIDRGRLEAYKALGINRVSLGAQSFEPSDLRQAGRLHEAGDTAEDFETLRRLGFDNINIDLIAGLPEQERVAWLGNLDWIERLGPEHVSLYLLELEDSSLWARRPPPMHSEDDHAWFYLTAAERLAAAGYVHYEVSSWARLGRECRHNVGYWTGAPYRGIGLGAHSFVDGKRFWNTRSMSEYARRIDAGELPIDAFEQRTPRIRVEEGFLLGLRRLEGFDIWALAREVGIEYPEDWLVRLNSLIEAGLVEFDGRILKLAPAGWLLGAGITEELLCPALLSTLEVTR